MPQIGAPLPLFLSQERTVPPVATSPFPDPVGQSAGVWAGVFRDEFDGAPSVLDSTNGLVSFGGPTWKAWYPDSADFLAQVPGGPHTNGQPREKEYYDFTGLSTAGSVLTMQARQFTTVSGLPYTSGMIQSNPSGNFFRGYFEARIRCSGVGGTWPAFWLSPSDWTWPPEVDIVEQFGTNTTPKITSWQNHTGGTPGTLNLAPYTGIDATAWHVYGLKWTASALTFYVDGAQVAQETVSTNIPDRNMFVLLDLAVDGNQTIDSASFPTTFQADYVRVWQ